MWKTQPGHEIADGDQTVTLTLGEGGLVMCMTHHLVNENNCVK